MRYQGLMIAGAMALASFAVAEAAEDLSSFGTPVESTGPARPAAEPNRWPAHVCAEIQRVEKIVISGPLHPGDRGIARGGLLMLEQLHCGIDVSKKMAVDQAAAQREYDENLQRAASQAPQVSEPVIVQVPAAAPEPAPPAPPPVVNCFTSRFGGGMSTTTCR
jgi:hypothetical protein